MEIASLVRMGGDIPEYLGSDYRCTIEDLMEGFQSSGLSKVWKAEALLVHLSRRKKFSLEGLISTASLRAQPLSQL